MTRNFFKQIQGFGLRALLAIFAFSFGNPAAAQTVPCGTTVLDLTAGQTLPVGTVTLSNDMNNIYVTYTLTDGTAVFGNLHLWIGNDMLNLPRTQSGPNAGTPIPGQFPYKVDATGLSTYTFQIPFTALLFQDAAGACGKTFYVVAHAEVDLDGQPGGSHETAFAGPLVGAGNRWWFYGNYTVCCDFGQPPVSTCNTAYAKAGYVWVTDRKSNPENLPSLALTRNRWGWAAKLPAPSTTPYTFDLWAGAGLNNTANGVKVGTVTALWDGSELTVTYAITKPGYGLKEAHLYAGDAAPTTIAPGQYGNTAYLNGFASSFTFTVSLADSDANGVWIVAHAVVCN